jgi:hypothetical protein
MRRVPFRKRNLFIVPAILLLAACATIEPPATKFPATVDNFMQQLRWKDFQGASQHMAEEYREGFLNQFSGLSDLRITDVRLESTSFREKDQRMETWAVLEYYLLPSISIKTFTFRQEWELRGADRYRSGTWVIVTPFPKFP